ncbi:MAG: sigma-54-dependent Fis family transcriptional regulator [Desulfobacterales bacterium]|uniref:Sigma-54-dependent Fis family transcriptional regulator n=1 Tax=Candidatus Desulfatibia profunda TaxID=2841695 RepID=A0A8J6NWA0_9BACT|nr:sigma-54-dependent Fis family transcriptional regulator [Candidatus Desulfatibia profunda]MBL7178987.1 sigma-54-dependent Fis family transcriptional regulator [Desulfobacterales bacterium]
MNNSIILVDDDLDFLETLKKRLINSGFKKIHGEDDSLKAASLFEKGEVFDIALIDMTMPGLDGIELLEIIKTISPRTECIMLTAVNDARNAVECLKKGAYDYLLKPVTQEDLVFSMKRTLEKKRLLDILDIEKSKTLPRLKNSAPFKPIITQSHKVLRILKEAELHAGSDVPVLITGESGTGKELVAKAIHAASPRSNFPFTPVNMASLSGSLFEAEFFGHTKGAFTGAENSRAGYLEHTNQGTMFLDEIGNLTYELQGKLLRVLQDGEYLKLGTSSRQKVDVRFIAATNEDMDKLIAKKMFRKDLFYRIRGGWLHLPPLRDRQADIPLLANRFLKDFCGRLNHCFIEEETMCLLMEYNYPGNIRELRSIIQSAVNLAQGRSISPNFLPKHLRKGKSILTCKDASGSESILSMEQVEKTHILRAYNHTGQNKSQTAKLLGISLNTLRRKLNAYGVT